MVANQPRASFGQKGNSFRLLWIIRVWGQGVIITLMCVREGCIQRLCRSNGSIFHQSSIVPGMAFIHYSFNFKWSFVDTFLGSRPDPCLWTRDIYHSPLSSNTATWLSSSHIGNLAALKRCSVFRSLANEVTLFMLCHLSRQPIISVLVTSPHHQQSDIPGYWNCPLTPGNLMAGN